VAEPSQHCTHPWLRVTCGVCGEAVDALGESFAGPDPEGATPRAAGPAADPASPQATFIVARGHPELIDQLRSLMGHGSGVQVIEDRRQRPRPETATEEAREIRRRLRDDGQRGPG
jgi:hypothetical protein